ncbi:MAG: hypothetical protein HZY78_06370 [Burkholderiaceae bacterium]|nr:MAG: hypothetical protein HZY78_06370 [Burkholderiaceae bacterium]
MMDELLQAVARGASLSPEQAALAVAAMLRFFTARLPSALVGELYARLVPRTPDATAAPDAPDAPGRAAPLASSARRPPQP